MKPNFHAIDAIVYGLRFGVTGIPAFLRRGWLGVLVALGASFGLFSAIWTDAHYETVQGNLGFGMFTPLGETVQEAIDDWGDDEVSFEWGSEEQEAIGEVLVFYGLLLISLILSIPGIVDAYRKSAGLEPSGGFLPTFGAAEWSLFFSTILVGLATLLVYATLGLPVGGLVAFGIMTEQYWAFFIAGVIALVGTLWWSVRASLIPIHSAIVGELAFYDGFRLTGGVFWKLIGTGLLAGIVFALIEFAVSLVILGTAFQSMFDVAILLNVLLYGYIYIAGFGIYGRIAGDLMGLTKGAETDPSDDQTPFADEAEETLDSVDDWAADASETIPVDRGYAAEQAPRQEPQMVRRTDAPRYSYGGGLADPAASSADHENAAAPQPTPAQHQQQGSKASVQFVRRRFRS